MCHSNGRSILIETQPRPRPRSTGGDPFHHADPDGLEALHRAKVAGHIRHDLVSRVRDQLRAGTYETDAKMNGAVSGVVGYLNVGSPKCADCDHPLDPKPSQLTCRNCGATFERRMPSAEAA